MPFASKADSFNYFFSKRASEHGGTTDKGGILEFGVRFVNPGKAQIAIMLEEDDGGVPQRDFKALNRGWHLTAVCFLFRPSSLHVLPPVVTIQVALFEFRSRAPRSGNAAYSAPGGEILSRIFRTLTESCIKLKGFCMNPL